MKNKKSNTFKELYEVRFNYTNEKGFRVVSQVDVVHVDVVHGVNEKCNHNKARIVIEEKYAGKKVEVTCVSYC